MLLERMSKRVLLLAGFASVVLAAFLTAGIAEAGEYHVYSCRTPSGESAPADGWSGSVAAGGAFDDYAKNTCAEGGALIAALGDQTVHIVHTDVATWAFAAPTPDTIAGATLWRAGDTDGGAAAGVTYQFWLSGPSETAIFDECLFALNCKAEGELEQPLSAVNRIVVPGANLGSRLYINASCGGLEGNQCPAAAGDSNNYAAAVYLFAADIKLEQNEGPSASGVSGELASAPAVSGSSDLAFSATDPGAGVYEALFSVDGQVVQSTVLDENGGHCRNVGQTTDGLAAFLYVQPCERSVSVDVPFDTTKVSDGSHHLLVSVIDAAGNSAPVLDREITVANPPGGNPPPAAPAAANGTNASAQATLTASWKGTSKERLTSGYGRAQTIIGRLTGPGGVPIGGAQIDLMAVPAYLGARPVAMASPRTGQDGRFSLRVTGGLSSRTLLLAYRSHLGDALPAATRTLILSVRAGILLSVRPAVSGVGRSIFFRGRLQGGPIPREGKQLVLEARSAGSPWIEFDVIRTDTRGRYHASYRFKFPGPVDYRFRVVSEPESDYPYAAGSSDQVTVRER
ncbi:MAG: hypothetical protein ABSG95_05585 [Solirubrobacteraceae bacterium]|jgi:hypothetical protein